MENYIELISNYNYNKQDMNDLIGLKYIDQHSKYVSGFFIDEVIINIGLEEARKQLSLKPQPIGVYFPYFPSEEHQNPEKLNKR